MEDTSSITNNDENEVSLSIEAANEFVLEHRGWAESIARSVARAWNLDWQLDGLDGAAMEALIFCARRFSPERGVPFRGYARRRIHEAATEAARRCRGWKRSGAAMNPEKRRAREVAVGLLNVFPELRDGELPSTESGDARGAIRQLLVGASLLASSSGLEASTPEDLVDYKKMVTVITTYEDIHQLLLWKVYWEGLSLRKVAAEWETDGLNVIREHKNLLTHLYRSLAAGRGKIERPKVRPGLRPVALSMRKKGIKSPFNELDVPN